MLYRSESLGLKSYDLFHNSSTEYQSINVIPGVTFKEAITNLSIFVLRLSFEQNTKFNNLYLVHLLWGLKNVRK